MLFFGSNGGVRQTLLPALCLIASWGLNGCGQNHNSVQNPANRADHDVKNSFTFNHQLTESAATGLSLDQKKITIEKSALEKEFLLQAQMVFQQEAPNFHGTKSRIVFFRQVDKNVYMIEASQGLLIARDYPQTLVMTEFPILNETPTALTIDFNAGMSQLFVAGDWHTRDFGIRDDSIAIKTRSSYISSASFTSSNQLEVHQLAVLEAPVQDAISSALPVEAVYYLAPYHPNPLFQPTIAPRNLDRMGFFEVANQFNGEGGDVSYASKNDISKPVVFAMSANTPKDYRDAVRDGILYWNKAFGKEVVKVIDAPQGVVAPHPEYNLVQWVDWDSAGFAYADAQMDPRTGEILHQQIYFTSAWAKIGRRELAAYKKSQLHSNGKHRSIGLRGFGSSELCALDANEMIAQEISNLVATEKDPAKLLKASTDLVREVVAHEVGHTLGLRHNFAGSLAANYAVEDREQIFNEYLKSQTARKDLVTASTVMDYQFPLEAMMHGDQLAKNPLASDYDTKAIQALYFGKKFKAAELPLFCTDSHVGRYLDCRPYDAGSSHVSWIKYSGRRLGLEMLPVNLVEKYIDAKAPQFGLQPVEVENVVLNPKTDALRILGNEARFVKILEKANYLLAVERKYPYVSSGNEKEIREKSLALVMTDLARNGDFEKVLVNSSLNSADGLYAKFEALLANTEVVRGTNAEGKPYEFTADELVIMKDHAKQYFKRLPLELVESELKILSGESVYDTTAGDPLATLMKLIKPNRFDSSQLADKFGEYVGRKALTYTLATAGEPLVFKRNVTSVWETVKASEATPVSTAKPETTTLALPRFAYPLEIRKKAAAALAPNRSEQPGWAFFERLAVQKAFKKMMGEALPNVDVKDAASLEPYPRDLIHWVLENQQVESSLGGVPALTPAPAGAKSLIP